MNAPADQRNSELAALNALQQASLVALVRIAADAGEQDTDAEQEEEA